MKILHRIPTLTLLLALGGRSNASAKELSSVVLQIKANIDGASSLVVKNNKLYWKHWGWAAPGLHLCYKSKPEGCTGAPKTCKLKGDEGICHLPTMVTARSVFDDGSRETTRKKWWPIWPYDGDDMRYDCGGCESSKLNLQKEFGINVGLTPKLSFWGWGEGRDCDKNCDGKSYGNPNDEEWSGKCCNSNTERQGSKEVITINFLDYSSGSKDYEFSLGLKPYNGDDDGDIDDDGNTDNAIGDGKYVCSDSRPDDFEDLKSDRYQLQKDGTFEGGRSTDKDYTKTDTGGCSCEQILKKLGKEGGNEFRFGCTQETMSEWIEKLRYVERKKLLVSALHEKPPYASAPFCMGLVDNKVSSGNQLKMRKCNAYNLAQCWDFKYRKTEDIGGYFRIHPCSNKNLCVQTSGSQGDRFTLESCSSSKKGQYFKYSSCSGDGKELTSMESTKLFVDPKEAGYPVMLEKCVKSEGAPWDLQKYKGPDTFELDDPILKYNFGSCSRSTSALRTTYESREGMGTGLDLSIKGAECSSSYSPGVGLTEFLGTTCPSGYSLKLDGKRKSYGEVPDNKLLRMSRFSISTWIRFDQKCDGTCTIISKGNTNEGNGYWIRVHGDNELVLTIANGRDYEGDVVAKIPKPRLMAWHHVVATYDGDKASLYVDGDLGGEETGMEIDYGKESFLVGAMTDRDFYFTGFIDDILLWDYALSPDDVTFLFESGPCYSCRTC